MPRMGNRGANQYQGYLDELSGSDRQGTERYGIGMPYYRSSVDPTFDPKGNREYRPNSKADRTYEQTQEVITRKYLAYFTEKDPKKRAELLKDYNRTRSNVSRAMSGRREDPTRALEAATADDFAERQIALSGPPGRCRVRPRRMREPRSSAARRSTRALVHRCGHAATSTGLIPPPPPLLPGSSTRRTEPAPQTVRSSGSFPPAQFDRRRRSRRPRRAHRQQARARLGGRFPPPLLPRMNETASSLTRTLQALQYADRGHSGGRSSA